MTDLQVGEVRGFRLFRMQAGSVLRSYSATYRWSPGRNEATCLSTERRGHGAIPEIGCGCGFWIYRDLDRCGRMFRTELLAKGSGSHRTFGEFEPRSLAVLGECRGWGRVLEGDDGWRTEYAAVDTILDIGQGVNLSSLAVRYEVPVVAASVDLALRHTGRLTARDHVHRSQRTRGLFPGWPEVPGQDGHSGVHGPLEDTPRNEGCDLAGPADRRGRAGATRAGMSCRVLTVCERDTVAFLTTAPDRRPNRPTQGSSRKPRRGARVVDVRLREPRSSPGGTDRRPGSRELETRGATAA